MNPNAPRDLYIRWIGALPAGDGRHYARGPHGSPTYRILAVAKVSRVGRKQAPSERAQRLRLTVQRVPSSEVPEGSVVHDLRASRLPPARRTPEDDHDPARRPGMLGGTSPAASEEEVRARIAEARRVDAAAVAQRLDVWSTPDAGVPPVQLSAGLKDAQGRRIAGPKAVRGEWDDPEDRSIYRKRPRKIAGFRRADPLIYLHKKGRVITEDHLMAAELYREAHERGPGRALPSRLLERVSGAPLGSDAAIDRQHNSVRAMREWTQVDEQFAKLPILRSALHSVVLERMDSSHWAQRVSMDRKVALGRLADALDMLVLHYAERITERRRRRQEAGTARARAAT